MPYGVWVRNGGTWVNSSLYVRNGGQWKLSNIPFLYLNELVIHILSANNYTATNQNIDLGALFESTYPGSWSYNVPKRVIIDPGAIVGATNTGSYALNISASLGGSLTIDNYGSILGAGGLPNGGNGGNAIIASSPVTFNNQGIIYAGGGAGGAGGTGGGGVYTTTTTIGPLTQGLFGNNQVGFNFNCNESCQRNYGPTYGGSWYCASSAPPSNTNCIIFSLSIVICLTCYGNITSTSYTSGGAGGAGGRGQGYDGNLTGGSPGGAGGINAGTGGTGGTGGNWGQSGDSGFSGSNGNYTVGTGGGPGGLAGFYIVNNGNVTWTNLGTVAGRVI